MHRFVTYEHPLNERIRTLLRLEFLFRQIKHFMSGSTVWDSRAVITNLMDILTVFGRGDLKTELLKELERHAANLARLSQNPDVDQSQLQNILHWLNKLRGVLQTMEGPLGQELRDNEFLSSVRQRSAIPGGTCDFDLPAYHQWLHRPHEQRHAELERWLETLDAVRQSVELIMKLIRNSAEPAQAVAEQGLYQHTLDTSAPTQLIRVGIPADAPYFVEISGSKHRFAVRFMEPRNGSEKPKQTRDAVTFRLTCCVL